MGHVRHHHPHHNHKHEIVQSMKEEVGADFSNTETLNTGRFGLLNMSIFEIDLLIRLKLRQNPIFGPKLGLRTFVLFFSGLPDLP